MAAGLKELTIWSGRLTCKNVFVVYTFCSKHVKVVLMQARAQSVCLDDSK